MSETDYQYGKGSKGGLVMLVLSVALVVGLAFFLQKKSTEPGARSLTVYCAAGIQPPVEEAAPAAPVGVRAARLPVAAAAARQGKRAA